ncbi:MAG: DUF600 family protein [bacterium]
MENFKKNIEEKFHEMANLMVDTIQEPWDKIVFGFVRGGKYRTIGQLKHVLFTGDTEYKNLDNLYWGKDFYSECNYNLQTLSSEFYDLCKKDKHDWHEFAMHITNDGNFKVNFSYEKIKKSNPNYISEWIEKYVK